MGNLLTYITKNGSRQQIELEKDIIEFGLDRKGIQSIDLSPLSSCHSLKVLDLSVNAILNIDLSHLSRCSSLEELRLDSNQLQKIDLAPISSCTSLKELNLGNNHLTEVDFTPLKSCTSFETLRMWSNNLSTIDLISISSGPAMKMIGLSFNQLQDIDLSPLRNWTSLEELDLSNNQLREIDLSLINSSVSLRKLHINGNKFKEISLAPLSSYLNLENLYLHTNQLRRIDLNPLSSCTNLRYLDLEINELESLDLLPLTSCTHLKYLTLGYNQVSPIDLTPLSFFSTNLEVMLHENDGFSWLRPSIQSDSPIMYNRPSPLESWPFLHQIVSRHGEEKRVQQDILCAMGLGEYGFIDSDLQDLLISIPTDENLHSIRECIRKHVLKQIVDAIEQNGTTTGLVIENLHVKGELAKYIPDLLKTRQKEIHNVRIGIKEGVADLRELYLTAYGYQILSALDMKLIVDERDIVLIGEAFEELGFDLRTGDISNPSVKMSEELKRAIWWIVEHRGRPWKDIKE